MFDGYRSSMVWYARSAVLRVASMRANARVMELKGTLLCSSCFQKDLIANSADLCARRTCLLAGVGNKKDRSRCSALKCL
jgi:hypothetical protein